eukprot:symbB.v1.2.036598.t1/scaffold5203.1/size29885/5
MGNTLSSDTLPVLCTMVDVHNPKAQDMFYFCNVSSGGAATKVIGRSQTLSVEVSITTVLSFTVYECPEPVFTPETARCLGLLRVPVERLAERYSSALAVISAAATAAKFSSETNSVWQCHAMPAKLCLSVQGVSIAPAPKAAPPKAASKHSVEVAKESPLPAEPAELLPRVKYGPWRRVSTAGSIHTMFLREDEEITTTEIYIPDFFDEEFDQRYDVRWKKRELLFTPAIGLHAGKEMLFAYDEEPQHVRFRDERICWNTGGYDPDCDRFIRSCLEIVMSVSSGVQLLPKNVLLKSALVPRADHIARGLSWPMEPWLGHLQHL